MSIGLGKEGGGHEDGTVPSPLGYFKFNVDRAVRGKLGQAGIGGVLHSEQV